MWSMSSVPAGDMTVEIRPCRHVELDRLMSLLDDEFIFGKGRTLSLRSRFPKVFCDDNLRNVLVGVESNEIVAALAMVPFKWCVDDENYRGTMIGAVYTHPARRRTGLASRLLDVAAAQLRHTQMDFGVLWTGQPAFYARRGWQSGDCSVFGEVERVGPETETEPVAGIDRLPVAASVDLLEDLRRCWLAARTLRSANEYRQMPIPAQKLALLWCADQDRTAYALLGSRGDTGYLYELVGDERSLPALWREVCRGQRRIVVNERSDSPACRFLEHHAQITWQRKNLAMWLPVSNRVNASHWAQWHIAYFDRI